MRGYDCVKDYYDNYLFGRSPEYVRRVREDSARERRDTEARTQREISDYIKLYGD